MTTPPPNTETGPGETDPGDTDSGDAATVYRDSDTGADDSDSHSDTGDNGTGTDTAVEDTADKDTDTGTADSRYTIVVGVSRTSRSPGALRWAVQEAAVHAGRVVAVRAWRPPAPQSTASTGKPPVVSQDRGSVERQESERLEADLLAVLGPNHQVRPRLVRGKRLAVLLAAGAAADLLVVDAPRRGELPGKRRLAVRLVQRATCPIVVMPPVLGDTGTGPLVTAGQTVASAGRAVGRSLTTSAGTAGRPGIRPPLPRPDS